MHEHLGGEILRTEVDKVGGGSVRHFYNRVAGERLDFTSDQFNIPGYWHEVSYQDVPSSVEEAKTELLAGQLEAMRVAFRRAIGGSNNVA